MTWSESQLAWLSRARHQMVEDQLHRRGIADQRVLDAMDTVPRHEFVDPVLWQQAYEDHPLLIGEGQTISQPYIVALTLEALRLIGSESVLEIGTGSGYQTALLAALCRNVVSIELHQSLATHAEATLARLGFPNVTVVAADGRLGYPSAAPFDTVVVSAAAANVPRPLFEQLREGGRMVMPVGSPEVQQLQLIRKQAGLPVITVLEGCRFVPLLGDPG